MMMTISDHFSTQVHIMSTPSIAGIFPKMADVIKKAEEERKSKEQQQGSEGGEKEAKESKRRA